MQGFCRLGRPRRRVGGRGTPMPGKQSTGLRTGWGPAFAGPLNEPRTDAQLIVKPEVSIAAVAEPQGTVTHVQVMEPGVPGVTANVICSPTQVG